MERREHPPQSQAQRSDPPRLLLCPPPVGLTEEERARLEESLLRAWGIARLVGGQPQNRRE